MSDSNAPAGSGEGSSAGSWAIGIAFLVIFLSGPASGTVKLAIAAGFIVFLARGGWGGH